MNKYKLALAVAFLAAALASPVFADSISLTIGTPPPAPIVETVPVAPGPPEQYVWRPGYWRWVDERHVWIGGHWMQRPRPEAVWVAPVWEHASNGYVFHEGHWDDHHEDHHDYH